MIEQTQSHLRAARLALHDPRQPVERDAGRHDRVPLHLDRRLREGVLLARVVLAAEVVHQVRPIDRVEHLLRPVKRLLRQPHTRRRGIPLMRRDRRTRRRPVERQTQNVRDFLIVAPE